LSLYLDRIEKDDEEGEEQRQRERGSHKKNE
jgi:hypothetical protein